MTSLNATNKYVYSIASKTNKMGKLVVCIIGTSHNIYSESPSKTLDIVITHIGIDNNIISL